MKKKIYTTMLASALLLALAVAASAQAAKTRVVDYARDEAGNPLTGKLTFIPTQKSAASADGLVVASPTVSATLDGTGKFDVYLYPSASLPRVSYYQVYVTGGAGSQTLLGIYNIPSSGSPVTLAPYKVTDANLAAQYTFASRPAVNALDAAAAALGAIGITNHALMRSEGGAAAAGGGDDAGGVIDLIQGSTARQRVHDNGQFEVLAGLKVSGGTVLHTGSYLDLRPTTPQLFDHPSSNLMGIGADSYVNFYHQPTPVNGLQFGAAFAIESGSTNRTPAGFPDNSKVALSAFAQNTPGATSTAGMYALNTISVQNATGSDLNQTGIEADCNKENVDATYNYPTKKSVCVHIVNGGQKHMQYGLLIQGSVNGPGKFLTGIKVRADSVAQGGIAIGDVTSEGDSNLSANLMLRQFGNTGHSIIVQRATDTSPSGYAFGVRNTANTAWLATIGVTGDVSTTGFIHNTSGVLQIENMPTTDPHVAGRFWRSGNDVKISTGP